MDINLFDFGISEQRCLFILASCPSTPYAIFKKFREAFGEYHHFSSSSFVYYHLKKLSKLGLIYKSDDLWFLTSSGMDICASLTDINSRFTFI
ncbi:MAG: hypothetical protein AB4372_32465 [Xenococcus sp. (in: cyanobacteria)]